MKKVDTNIFGDHFSKYYPADLELNSQEIGRLTMLSYNDDTKYKKIYIFFNFNGDEKEFNQLKNIILTEKEDNKIAKEQYELPEEIIDKLSKGCLAVIEELYNDSCVTDITDIKKIKWE